MQTSYNARPTLRLIKHVHDVRGHGVLQLFAEDEATEFVVVCFNNVCFATIGMCVGRY